MKFTSTLFSLFIILVLSGCSRQQQKTKKLRHIEQIEQQHQTAATTYQRERDILAQHSQEELLIALQEYVLVHHDHYWRTASAFTSKRYVSFPFIQYKTTLDRNLKTLDRKIRWLEKKFPTSYSTLKHELYVLLEDLRIIRKHLATFKMYQREKKLLDERELRTIARHGGLPGLIYLFLTA